MPRVSKAQAAQNRQRTVQAAAELFRERGVDHVSVQDIMAAVGLTHGGFYRQFDSKEALVPEAARHAYDTMAARLADLDASAEDHAAAQREFIRTYLSPTHRDHPGKGCPTAGLIHDITRSDNADTRDLLTDGVAKLGQWLNQPGRDGVVTVCTLLGALLVSRAAAGTPLSGQVLERVSAELASPR
ncbi:TetR/AcrR family transcriptional regulator [Deinococcus hopiensis]|uniref:Transcriptional regulator, TetR family n=1 Tax=Deinococcus hopiensis KR-140 TaxID=695939 RepID=A0A1W1VUB3_9DEIO|nr:TetR/AcrR family transcriptional regulator [Deinococcus hopiensis]SMB96948.1 transcriptional regulator, TetR family [Deinococcus hopiensis KR-140]